MTSVTEPNVLKKLGPSQKQLLKEKKGSDSDSILLEDEKESDNDIDTNEPKGVALQTPVLSKLGLEPTNALSSYQNSIDSNEDTDGATAIPHTFDTDAIELEKKEKQVGDEDAVHRTDLQTEIEAWDAVEKIRHLEELEKEEKETGVEQKPRTNMISYKEAERFLRNQDFSEYRKQIQVHDFRNVGWFMATQVKVFGKPKLNSALRIERDQVFGIACTPCNWEYAEHEQMLQTIYRQLTGDKLPCPRQGSHWAIVGFQGNDPTTDLRGGGMLGPLQMLYLLSNYRSLALKIHQLSRDELQNFPFAIVGFNITGMCMQSLREGQLYSRVKKNKGVLNVLNELFVAIYFRFYLMWKQNGSTIKDFNATREFLLEQSRNKPEKMMKYFQTNNSKTIVSEQLEFTELG